MSQQFNPAGYLRTIIKRRKVKEPGTGKEHWINEVHQYLDVKYRVLWFRQAYPDGYIDTSEIAINDKFARVEAIVYDRDPAAGGTRLGKARRQVWAADFKDYVEKCETQAIGRALALAGFGTQFCDELDEDSSLADSLVETSKDIVLTKATAERQVYNKDINLLHGQILKLASNKGLSKEDIRLISMFKYQKEFLHQLNNNEISNLINGLQNTSPERLQGFIDKLKTQLKDNIASDTTPLQEKKRSGVIYFSNRRECK